MASKRNQRRKACAGKRRFGTESHALAACRWAVANGGEVMRPYACKWCKGFHIGHWAGRHNRLTVTDQSLETGAA